jgi:peptidoglycan/xylan/chitin deacetylase (PgdA/CDA1 family)
MILFSIGFVSGMKIFKKTGSDIAKGQIENNIPIQGNKDNSGENVDKPQDSTTPDPNSGDSPQKNDPNSVVTTPNKPSENPSPTDAAPDKKEVFLTFDDGPTSKVTPRILKILDDYNVKATFFVIGKNAEKYPELIKQAQASGHLIANHTYSHDYNFIYSSTDNFLIDLEKSNQVLASILGSFDNKIIRFPGGSFGAKRTAYRDAVTKAGYTYVDWNALNGDAADPKRITIPSAELVQNLKTSVNSVPSKNKNHVVVLMHDAAAKSTTADSLPEIIEFLKSQGYEFKTLAE